MVDFIIINAIAPSVYMYDDRIEVVSYGVIPYSLSIEGFFFGTGISVNKSLLTIFMVAKYAEQSGHGVSTIVEIMLPQGSCREITAIRKGLLFPDSSFFAGKNAL